MHTFGSTLDSICFMWWLDYDSDFVMCSIDSTVWRFCFSCCPSLPQTHHYYDSLFVFVYVCVPPFQYRVRENLLNTLTRKFIDEMKAYQAAQQKYKTDIQNKMKRQVKVVKPDATDAEVDEIMRSEGGRDALYKQTILAGGVNDEIT